MTIMSEQSVKTGLPTDMMLEKGMEIVNGVSVGEHNPYVPVRELGTVERALDYRGVTITTTVYRVGGGDRTEVKFKISQKVLEAGLRRGLDLCQDDARWQALTLEVRCGHSRQMEELMRSLTVSAPWLGAALLQMMRRRPGFSQNRFWRKIARLANFESEPERARGCKSFIQGYVKPGVRGVSDSGPQRFDRDGTVLGGG